MMNEEGTEKLHAPPDFDGPTGERKCTDVFCTLLLLVCWAAMTGLGVYAYQNGDYRVILYPMDYDGNICGTNYGNIDMTNYSYLYYVNSYSGGVCVKECPSLENLTDVFTAVSYGGIYQTEDATLPSDFIQVADYSSSDNALYCGTEFEQNLCYPFGSASLSWTSPGINRGFGFAYYAVDTYELFWRCVHNDDAVDKLKNETQLGAQSETERFLQISNDSSWTDALLNGTGASSLDLVASTAGFWENLFGDLWTAKSYILGLGFGVSVIVGFVYAYFLRVPCVLPIMVWGSIVAGVAMFFISGYYAYQLADKWVAAVPQTTPDETIQAARIASYVCWAIGGFLVLLFCCLRKQIQLSMICVKKTGKALASMPLITLFPILQAAGFAAFMVAFFVYGIHLASLGQLDTKEYEVDVGPFSYMVTIRDFDYDDFVERSAWFLLFCFYWTSHFIIAMGEIIVAMSAARWFFSRDKSRIGSGTVCSSICTSLRYHIGTAAFGSLLVAIVEIIRSILAKLQKKAKDIDSKIAQAILCCLQCIMACFERCLKFLNKNAYIQTAIFGTSFCQSAKEAFCLISRNAARVAAITYVSGLTVFVGRLVITAITCGLGYIAIEETYGDQLYSPIGPVVFVGLIAFFVAGMFMSIFDMCISTILHCFVADEEMFDEGSRYADGKLVAYVDKYGEEGGEDEF